MFRGGYRVAGECLEVEVIVECLEVILGVYGTVRDMLVGAAYLVTSASNVIKTCKHSINTSNK